MKVKKTPKTSNNVWKVKVMMTLGQEKETYFGKVDLDSNVREALMKLADIKRDACGLIEKAHDNIIASATADWARRTTTKKSSKK